MADPNVNDDINVAAGGGNVAGAGAGNVGGAGNAPNVVDDSDSDEEIARRPPPPRPLPPAIRQYAEFWHKWYTLIVNRGHILPVQQIIMQYTAEFVSNDQRPAPFPLNLSETWYCALFLVLVLGTFRGADKGWLYEDSYPYPQWAGRVLGRVFITVGAAVLSTISFEVIGSVATEIFFEQLLNVQDMISAFLITRFGWGVVDDNGEPIRNGFEFLWIRHRNIPREQIRDTLFWLTTVILEYLTVITLVMVSRLPPFFTNVVIAPILHWLFGIPVDLAPKLVCWMTLPTPGTDNYLNPRAIWFEHGMAIMVQFWVIVFFWFLVILYFAKAERLGLRGYTIVDPLMSLIRHLLGATTLHLVAYTAYQIVCAAVAVLRSELAPDNLLVTIIDGHYSPFVAKLIPEGRIVAAIFLLCTHYALRSSTIIMVIQLQRFWVPYILWQTRFSDEGVYTVWDFWVALTVRVASVFPLGNRVVSRVGMTALFGLKSSWPAAIQLNPEVADNP